MRGRKEAAFDVVIYNAAARDYRACMAWSDRILYDMCQGSPRHADPARVHGKLSLIGRSYATRVERLLESDGQEQQGGALRRWREHFVGAAGTLDRIVRDVRKIYVPLSEDRLRRTARLHGELCGLMQRADGYYHNE
ncbi:hypothetical protein JXD38_03300, partial [candidate division WOR-3 bacterium]|nr:hypothetical protein [candidate division WOR-3 bacterium]